MDFSSAVPVVGASQGIFLSMLFLSGKKRHPSMILLAFYLFLFSCGLLERYHHRESSGIFQNVFFSFIANGNLLYGPLIFLFVEGLNQKKISGWKITVHGLPFIVLFVVDILFIIGFFRVASGENQLLEIAAFELLVIQLLIYSIISVHRYRQMRKWMLNTYSNIDQNDVNWMLYLLYLMAATYILSFALSHLLLFGILSDDSPFFIIQLLITLFTYLLGYRMIVKPSFFLITFQEPTASIKPRYRKSGLKSDQAKSLLNTINLIMADQLLFKNPDLTIYELSQLTGISRNHLTETINLYAGCTFNDYVNGFRVEEAKRLLTSQEFNHLSVSGIGKVAGFRSPNAFFTNFKKFTGTTPSMWKGQTSRGDEQFSHPSVS